MLQKLLEKLFSLDFSNCEMSEDICCQIESVFNVEEILYIDEKLYTDGKMIDLSAYHNKTMNVYNIADYVNSIAYNIVNYEIGIKERIAKKKAIEKQIRAEFADGTRQFPKEYPILIRTESEEWTDGWATDTTYTYYYQMPDGSKFYDNKTHPTCDEHIIQRAIKAEIAHQIK